MNEKFYLTSPIFYPNAKLHLGHAYTMTLCDALARWYRLSGREVCFLTGADENTGKVVEAADELEMPLETFLDTVVGEFKSLYDRLNIVPDVFVRTTDRRAHWPGVLEMWRRLVEQGDIYKGTYVGLYCPQCEAYYTEKELVEGKCPLHGVELQKLEEENYFFRLSKYTDAVKEKLTGGELAIVPATRRNEIMALLERGLEDVSFSRPALAVPQGIPVPGDPAQVIYVWCDALTSYLTGIGFGQADDSSARWWPAAVQVMGKDILRFHAAIWPAMLISAGLPLPKQLLVHGFILSGGQKMSKSRGNVIDPIDLINEYGADAVRYYLLAKLSPFEDGDLTLESFKNAYNGDLANGLGNLVSRILKMAEQYDAGLEDGTGRVIDNLEEMLSTFNIKSAMDEIWWHVGDLDKFIADKKPFVVFKTDPVEAKKIVTSALVRLRDIAVSLRSFMPGTSEKILECIRENKVPSAPLFLRKD